MSKPVKARSADQLLKQAHAAHMAIEGEARFVLERAIEAGDRLLAAKELVAHGHWVARVEASGIPRERAARYMQIARNRDRVLASGATSIRQAVDLLADRVPPRHAPKAQGTSRRSRQPSDRYTEGYEAGYRAGRADGGTAARVRGRAAADGLPSERDLRWLIGLAHPDRHHEDAHGVLVATRVTTWLNELRERSTK